MFTVSTQRLVLISALTQVALPLMAAASPAPSCRTTPGYELRIHVVNDAGAPLEVLEMAAAEADQIWDRVGLQFQWTFPPAQPAAPDGRSLIVVIRRTLTPVAPVNAAGATGRVRTPLGWLVFDEEGRSGHLIEVSLEQTIALVRKGKQLEMPTIRLPEFAQERSIGRGLGRVIAHEIGHWLMGRGHVETGLMKSRFHAQDLVEFQSPELPKSWVAAGDAADSASRCVPVALHRLATD